MYIKESIELMFQTMWNSLVELFNEHAKLSGMPSQPNESSGSIFGASVLEISFFISYKRFKMDKGVR